MGPWGEPELLVWRPEAIASEPSVPVGLEVKLGALVLLLLLTLLCSLVPVCVLRRSGAGHEASGESLPLRSWERSLGRRRGVAPASVGAAGLGRAFIWL